MLWILLLLIQITSMKTEKIKDLEAAWRWMEVNNGEAERQYYENELAGWNHATNLTEYNSKLSVQANVRLSTFKKETANNASLFDWESFQDPFIQRQFKKLTQIGTSILPTEEVEQFEQVVAKMTDIYSTGKVCLDDICHDLEPGLTRLFATTRDWDVLAAAWKEWRDKTGRMLRHHYPEYVRLQNKAATLNGFEDMGACWRSWYEMDNFESEVERLWNTVKPLYQQLHAYVRKKLRKIYAGKPFPASGHIPAHILGNMWGQTWDNLADMLRPYPNAYAINVTRALVEQDYNATRLVQLADDFFVSLGFDPVPDAFWEHSMLERPQDGREVVCHAAAYDFYNRKDFRIRQCTDINMEYLFTTHHEMGHIQYYMQYKNLPVVFRDGANPAFHEAVGDIIYLSVSTPEHLHRIGLLDHIPTSIETDINFLMTQALAGVSLLPFTFLVDKWRWPVFRGEVHSPDYNDLWWKLRCEFQGVSPPVTRTAEDFDPGAKFHIPANYAYIRYFVSFILQYQFHRALCNVSNHSGPLHRCDIYNSKEAGAVLRQMLIRGSSVRWQEALKHVTGTETMDANALLQYFKPLYDWLINENKDETIGWEDTCPNNSGIINNGFITGLTCCLVLGIFLSE